MVSWHHTCTHKRTCTHTTTRNSRQHLSITCGNILMKHDTESFCEKSVQSFELSDTWHAVLLVSRAAQNILNKSCRYEGLDNFSIIDRSQCYNFPTQTKRTICVYLYTVSWTMNTCLPITPILPGKREMGKTLLCRYYIDQISFILMMCSTGIWMVTARMVTARIKLFMSFVWF
jgi:hypothetical protein